MTPARKAALAWFHDRGEVTRLDFYHVSDAPTDRMMSLMLRATQIQVAFSAGRQCHALSLTDKGRRDLHEAGR